MKKSRKNVRDTILARLCGATIALAAGMAAASAGPSFHPGEVWLDAGGKPIQAHGGGILRVAGTWYWYGEDRTAGRRTSVSCYSSTNLYEWKHEGVALTNSVLPVPVVERPKVIYCPRTRKYVMWMHLEQRRNYQHAHAGVATADSPAGPFVFLHQLRPVREDTGYAADDANRQKELGGTFRDMNLFVDDDGKAYVLYASEGNWTLYIVRLNDEFTGPEQPMAQGRTWGRVLVRKMREAPAPFKCGGRYYLLTSGCTGWAPNAADYAIADHILGPYESKGNPCIGPDAERTFGGQSTFVLPAPGRTNAFIAMFDRWKPGDLGDSRYVWLPLIVKAGGTFTLEWRDAWDLSAFDAAPSLR